MEARWVNNSWDDILREGETLRWQGQPVMRISWRDLDWRQMVTALFFVGFAVYWAALFVPNDLGVASFSLIFLGAGLGMVFVPALLARWRLRGIYYTLSNRRAFIARRSLIGRMTLESYVIRPDTALRLVKGATESIYFAEEHRPDEDGGWRRVRIGFESLADSTQPMRMMEQMKRGEG